MPSLRLQDSRRAVALPVDVSATEAACTAVLSTVGAMAGHDAAKSLGGVLRVLAARPQQSRE